jgi:hypothetical protein
MQDSKDYKTEVISNNKRASVDFIIKSPENKTSNNIEKSNCFHSNHRSVNIQASPKRDHIRNISIDETRKDQFFKQESQYSKYKGVKPKTLDLILESPNSNKVLKLDFAKSKSKDTSQHARLHKKSESDINNDISELIKHRKETNKQLEITSFAYKKKSRIFCCF